MSTGIVIASADSGRSAGQVGAGGLSVRIIGLSLRFQSGGAGGFAVR